MTLKDDAINKIIDVEGGYVDDPDDSGGETNYGITLKVARDYGYAGEMIDMPRDLACEIYAVKYWHSLNGDALSVLSEKVAYEVVDTGINMGIRRAAEFLQRALSVMNLSEDLYADLDIDRSIGPATLSALATFLETRDEDVLVKALNCLQGAFYIELAERREKDESFVYGWLRTRVEL